MPSRPLIAVAGLMLLASGCSSSSAPAPSQPAGRSLGTGRALTPRADHALPTTPQHEPGTPFVSSWGAGSVDGNSRRLVLAVRIGGGCDRLDHVSVQERKSSVTISPIVHHYEPAGTICEFYLKSESGYVTLRRPLGHRRLVHARTTRPHN